MPYKIGQHVWLLVLFMKKKFWEKDEIMQLTVTQIELEDIKLSKLNQEEKDKHSMISLICGTKSQKKWKALLHNERPWPCITELINKWRDKDLKEWWSD